MPPCLLFFFRVMLNDEEYLRYTKDWLLSLQGYPTGSPLEQNVVICYAAQPLNRTPSPDFEPAVRHAPTAKATITRERLHFASEHFG